MKTLGTKLVLSAVGIAMLAAPAFAQRPRHAAPQGLYNYQAPAADAYSGYPNPVARSGSAEQAQSGEAFGLGRGY